MSVLIDFIVDLFAEIFVDSMVDGIAYLMQLIVPEKKLNESHTKVLRIIVFVYTIALLSIWFYFGFIGMFFDENPDQTTKCLFFIPLALIIIQITIGIVVKIVRKNK